MKSCQTNLDVTLKGANRKTKFEVIKPNDIETFPLSKFDDILKSIPGFDRSLEELKVETLNNNQIIIKHCVKNVTIQFDVNVINAAAESLLTGNVQTSYCISLPVTVMSTNVYKCKTPIINGMLPEQLCTILPLILDNSTMYNNVTAPKILQKNFDLTPIPEVLGVIENSTPTACISSDHQFIHMQKFRKISQINIMKDECKEIVQHKKSEIITNGTFRSCPSVNLIIYNFKKIAFKTFECCDILLKLKIPNIFYCQMVSSVYFKKDGNKTIIPTSQSKPNTCTAVILYTGVNPILNSFNLRTYQLKSNISIWSKSTDIHMNPSGLAGQLFNSSSIFAKMSQNGNGMKLVYDMDLIGNNIINNILMINTNTKNYNHKAISKLDVDQKIKNDQLTYYKQCKYINKVGNEKQKCMTTPLNEICNLEDFLKVLGLGNVAASILDGDYGEKLLSSLHDVRNYK